MKAPPPTPTRSYTATASRAALCYSADARSTDDVDLPLPGAYNGCKRHLCGLCVAAIAAATDDVGV